MPIVVETLISDTLAQTTSSIIDLESMDDGCAIAATYSNGAPSAKTFVQADVSVSGNTVTKAAHGFVTGLKVQLTTTGTLPAGVTTGVDYFIIKVSSSVIKFASSLANAEAGTAIDLTDDGDSGTHTITAVTSAGNVLKLQASVDGSNFQDISGDTVTIATSTGVTVWNKAAVRYRYIKALYTPSAGQIALTVKISYRLKG